MRNYQLNTRAEKLVQTILEDQAKLRISVCSENSLPLDDSNPPLESVEILDFGIEEQGGFQAGKMLAEVCLAGLGTVSFIPSSPELWHGPSVQVQTDHPVAACLASQYAGWEVKTADFFAMGSGPMRAAAAVEPLFESLNAIIPKEETDMCVGVLESAKIPTPEACTMIAEKCNVPLSQLTLLVAPTKSLAGTVQIVARSIETALHKMHEIGFDISLIESGIGTAPLPPPATDDLASIGRTNDAILYGGEVTLYVRGDDTMLEHYGPKIPSSSSKDFGRPFAKIFADYSYDFYQVDPLLFSPASIVLSNITTGNSFRYGQVHPRVIHESFGLV